MSSLCMVLSGGFQVYLVHSSRADGENGLTGQRRYPATSPHWRIASASMNRDRSVWTSRAFLAASSIVRRASSSLIEGLAFDLRDAISSPISESCDDAKATKVGDRQNDVISYGQGHVALRDLRSLRSVASLSTLTGWRGVKIATPPPTLANLFAVTLALHYILLISGFQIQTL
jgi:hypothetical protein